MSKRFFTNIRYTIFILLVIGAALLGLLLLRSAAAPTPSSQEENKEMVNTQYADGVLRVKTHDNDNAANTTNGNADTAFGQLEIPVAIADTAAKQQQGLSDTPSLPANDGMLFAFDTPGKIGFWMKDMNYSLDFVWLDNSMKIVAIDTDVTPATYPKIYYPPQDISYVLEVNAGFSTTHNL